MRAVFVLSTLSLASAGCLDRELAPLNPCTISGVAENVSVENVDEVDLLFMVDNSGSMSQEQASLAMQLPRLVRILATGDLDQDGTMDFPPVRSLHVGVVSSDMGTGGHVLDTCADPIDGDDGILLTRGRTDLSGCTMNYPRFLEFDSTAGTDPDQLARDFACVAQLGTGGCGFEQQLEAVLKAVTVHADGANAGFLREGSLLGIIVLTDEEDCSLADAELANRDSAIYPGNLNLRCFQYPQAVQPIARYVDGLIATRPNPDLLVYGLIAGVPTDAVTAGGETDYEAILAHPLMTEEVDAIDMNRLRPSCDVPGRGLAWPPRRLVSVARDLEARGANAVVQSICQADYGPALTAILEKIATVLGGSCLPRELTPNDRGLVDCEVVEALPLGARCADIPGRELLRSDADGREVCRVEQLPRGEVDDANGNGVIDPGEVPRAGWYYDDFTADVRDTCDSAPRRIAYTPNAEPITDTDLRLECVQFVQTRAGDDPGAIGLGTRCDLDPSVCDPAGLTCDPSSNTCQDSCASDADCAGSGLAGWRCGAAGFCVNPTCG